MLRSPKPIPDNKPEIKKKINSLKKRRKTSPQNLSRNEQSDLLTLKSLFDKERALLAERDQLLDVEETLKKRIINEIKTKKSRILDLQTEIPELKQRIENLAKVLKIPVVKK
jgi:exonuclease VII large subunit